MPIKVIRNLARASEVLNHKRALSLRMIRRLHDGFRIFYESLLSEAA
jgi:HTH-type transcriptional regulator/antitoxin HigA